MQDGKLGITGGARSLLAVAFLAAAFLFGSAWAAEAAEAGPSVIEVSGEGIIDAAPDQAKLLLAVITEGRDSSQAQRENSSRSEQLIKTLRAKGIAENDIKTQNYYLSPKYSQPPQPLPGSSGSSEPPQIAGYEVHHTIQVKVHNIDLVGQIMDAAIKNGANQISNVSFSVSNSLEYKKKALQEAVAGAKIKADVLAAALGKSISGVQSASGSWNEDNVGTFYSRDMAALAGSGGNEKEQAALVNPGLVQIRAHASVTYLIN